ncbi:biotin--[acetyl-CoA-carboxylase] ligase [Flavobacterium selenitireducens]|uniref:biotin--[acetyl-CoA-carboxylase] ligase n=1 Tax=Flavobacterium selenitireducens TaxID=2722704 RepID=UPI00168BF121|nr:biotin--[acetyl-CoA-carboxylase] ligase [Flavobacterium selenitireducens]MBD3583795.1 biotin--[acetyl-CoA-carboxylase] ligase [Flavobacterium selenitireducens]
MHFIKLDAIGSTNDFLKDLAKRQTLRDFTVVTANSQTDGRGQRGSVWKSEPGKNLTMSVFFRLSDLDTAALFMLNAAVALSVLEALKSMDIHELTLKWPNDIMSGNKKVGGILIENNVKTATEFESVIGIGINVNQDNFEGLPNAGSLHTVSGKFFDKDDLGLQVARSLETQLSAIKSEGDRIWERYNESLFRKGKPTVFVDESGKRFMGIVIEASKDGTLAIMHEDDSVTSYGIKQLTMLY